MSSSKLRQQQNSAYQYIKDNNQIPRITRGI